MGKPKLKSTIKALHNAILGFKPAAGSKTMTWVCVQQAKTDSFREVYKSYNSMYYSSSATSSDLCSVNEETDPQESRHTLSTLPSGEESFSATTSSSSTTTTTEWTDSHPTELVLKGFISSRRFFFSPCTTKSIMEEAHVPVEEEKEMGLQEKAFSCDRCVESVECLTMTMEMDFCKESLKMAMASHNPYRDFRVSMEEMVEAHGLREWSCLQELLHCYLRLNDQTTHKIIVLAFVDLVMDLSSEDPNRSGTNSNVTTVTNVNKKNCFPLPLSLPLPLCLDL